MKNNLNINILSFLLVEVKHILVIERIHQLNGGWTEVEVINLDNSFKDWIIQLLQLTDKFGDFNRHQKERQHIYVR